MKALTWYSGFIGTILAGGALIVNQSNVDTEKAKETFAAKVKLTESFNEMTAPQQVKLIQGKMAAVACEDNQGRIKWMSPAPKDPKSIEKALATPGCYAAALVP